MADKLSLDGSLPMAGPLDMAGQDIVNTGTMRPRDTGVDDLGSATKRYKTIHLSEEVKGPAYSRLADDIISLAPFPVSAGNIPFFNTADGRTLRDIGLSSDKLMLTDGTAIMTGDLDMGNLGIKNTANVRAWSDSTYDIGQDGVFYRTVFTRKIQGVERIETRDDDCNVRMGSGTTLTDGGSNVRNVWLGFDQTGSGFGLTMIGDSNTQTTGPGPAYIIGSGNSIDGSDCSIIGGTNNFVNGNRQFSYVNGNSNHVTGSFCVVTGTLNTAAGDEAIIFGDNSTAQNRAIAIGFSANNDQDDTCLIGGTGITNIRPNSLICDLGTPVMHFNAAYLKGGSVAASNYYSDYGDFVLTNNAAETIVDSGTTLGTNAFAATQSLGQIIVQRAQGTYTAPVTVDCTLRFKVNGGTMLFQTLPGPAAAGTPFEVRQMFVIKNGVTYMSSELVIDGAVASAVKSVYAAYDRTISNAFTITADWGVANPAASLSVYGVQLDSSRAT